MHIHFNQNSYRIPNETPQNTMHFQYCTVKSVSSQPVIEIFNFRWKNCDNTTQQFKQRANIKYFKKQ